MTEADIPLSKGKAARLKALEEIEEEQLAKSVKVLKGKYRERQEAQTVLSNIEREIKELELQIDQGNLPD